MYAAMIVTHTHGGDNIHMVVTTKSAGAHVINPTAILRMHLFSVESKNISGHILVN